jgi:hypothetical protein
VSNHIVNNPLFTSSVQPELSSAPEIITAFALLAAGRTQASTVSDPVPAT